MVSPAFGNLLASASGGTQTAVTSQAIGQTTSWPSAGYPIAKDIVELDGTLVTVIELRGKLTTEVDLSRED